MNMMLSFGLLASFMLTALAGEWTDVGNGFYLPTEEIGVVSTGGKSIFSSLPDSCIYEEEDNSIVKEQTTFDNSESFYRNVAAEAGLSVKLTGKYTMGATLRAKMTDASIAEEEVSGASINIYNYVSTAILDKGCISGPSTSLSEDLVTDFKSLSTEVDNPHKQESWTKYHDFLKTYGTHVVTHTYFGASLQVWTFANKTEQYTQEQINNRSCVDFAGDIAYVGDEIKACVGITEDQVEQVKNLNMQFKLEVHGGSDETQKQLENNRSAEMIRHFLNEGRELKKQIKNLYTPIWDIIRWKVISDPGLTAAALNLQQYYIGYLDFGCELIETPELELRRFEKSPYDSKDVPNYQCVLEKEGCHEDSDCKSTGGFESNCDGPTCVEHLPALFGFKAERAGILTERNGTSYEEISQSCDYNVTSKDGKCNYDYFQNIIIWEHARIQPPTLSGTPEIGSSKTNKLLCLLGIFLYLF